MHRLSQLYALIRAFDIARRVVCLVSILAACAVGLT